MPCTNTHTMHVLFLRSRTRIHLKSSVEWLVEQVLHAFVFPSQESCFLEKTAHQKTKRVG